MFGTGSERAACFTECTRFGLDYLLRERRYSPFGVAFSKDVIFQAGGGPALYIREDEWNVENLPPRLKARVVALWPGADPDHGEVLSDRLRRESNWLLEREWRVPTDGTGFSFSLDDVAFLIVTDPAGFWPENWFWDEDGEIRSEAEGLVESINDIPRLDVNEAGVLPVKDTGLWVLRRDLPETLVRPAWRLMTSAQSYWWQLKTKHLPWTLEPQWVERAAVRLDEAAERLALASGQATKGQLHMLALEEAACSCGDKGECEHLAQLIHAIRSA